MRGQPKAVAPPTRIRLFCAVEIPDRVRARIEAAFEPWRERFPTARWTPPENWHVTLKFIGSVDPGARRWIQERLDEVAGAHPVARTRVHGVGCFPSRRRARVLWAGLEDQTPADAGGLASLASALDEALAPRFPAGSRGFSGHVTIARIRGEPARVPEGYLATSLRSEPFTTERIVLFRSHLDSSAPRYEPLARFALASG